MADQETNNGQDQELSPSPKDSRKEEESPPVQNAVPVKEKPAKIKVKRSLFRKIINVFIGIFLGIVILILTALGFSQTKTFRETLREKVIALVNKEINGTLNIEKIDGTILTSLFLRNTSIIVNKDTLLFARNIEVKTSPLQLLLKKIFVRKVLLEDVKVAMLQSADGEWNFKKLIKPKPEDTTKSNFSLLIQVNDLQLRNIQFVKQTYQNYKSQKDYPVLNTDDLRIRELYLSAQAFADIQNSDYLLVLKELSFKPNLSRFKLRNISGEFAITKNFASVTNFYFLTDSSEAKINARIDSLNLFGNVKLEDFKNYPVSIDADAPSFNFDDLSSFINSTELLKGNPGFKLKAHGKFGGFKIDKLVCNYRDTHIEMNGQVLHLNVPSKLYFQAKVINSDLNYKDVNSLLPTLKLPEYAKLQLRGVNIEYEGEPLNFKSKFTGNVDGGNITGDVAMNLGVKPMTYDIKFSTEDLNLEPVLNINTKLNSSGSFVGKGFSPMDIASDLKLNILKSTINEIPLDHIDVSAVAQNKNIGFKLDGKGDEEQAHIIGEINFDKDTIPSFNFSGRLKQLNLAKFLKDKNFQSNLNFYFTAEGKNFDPDEMNGKFTFGVDSSLFRNKVIENSSIVGTFKKDSTHRSIALSSDFVDFNINGNFSLMKAVDLVAYESKTIGGIISKKVTELNPISIINRQPEKDSVITDLPAIVNEDLKFDYDFKFKDFQLIAMLMGNDQFDISGSGAGAVSNKGSNFSVSTQLKLDYLVMLEKEKTFYLSDINTGINFTRDNRYLSFDKLFCTASLTGKRFYTGNNIKSISADVTFNQSKLFFDASANFEDMISAEAEGIIKMTPNEQQLLVDRLALTYNGIEWTNKDTMKVLFNPNYFKIAQCQVQHDTSQIKMNGVIQNTGNQNLTIEAERLSGDVLGKYLLGFTDNRLIANGSLNGKIEGKFESPVINLLFNLKGLQVETTKLGNVKGSLSYQNKKMNTNFAFLDLKGDESKPLFFMKSNLPIDLSFAPVKERMIQNENLDVQFKSENFNLASLGRILPKLTDQSGMLSADVKINGTFKNPVYSGYLNLTNGLFTTTLNNLAYTCGLKLSLDKSEIKVDSLVVSNAGGTKYSGTITGGGKIYFDGFDVKDIQLRFNGDLAVLGQRSQSVSPIFYGDLLIGTDGDWLLTKSRGKVFFKGDVLMKQTDLVYTTGQANNASNTNFNFIYAVDSSKIDNELLRFHQVLTKEKDLQKQQTEKLEQLNFDYDIGISTQNNAKLVFILSQAINQRLTVDLRGGLKYSNYSGDSRAQGVFELLPGSKLEFFKTFDATGFLRFESDVTNPYLDVISTYSSDYVNPRDEVATPQEVAVKIKIKGPLSDLGKNLANSSESLGIYIGARNIQNNIRETRYDYADAFSFILSGKFKDDLTAQDKALVAGQTNAIGNTASSFLGSILTNFVNNAVGDLVNNIQISQSGYSTKFSLSGRIQNLRYTIGGTTQVFQNIGKASVKLEYPFTPSFLIRLERKEPIATPFALEDKISEMALKYKFEF